MKNFFYSLFALILLIAGLNLTVETSIGSTTTNYEVLCYSPSDMAIVVNIETGELYKTDFITFQYLKSQKHPVCQYSAIRTEAINKSIQNRPGANCSNKYLLSNKRYISYLKQSSRTYECKTYQQLGYSMRK